ncbi:MAG: hypothetical protein NTW38_03485 [Candidatus Aminicenantes bacterium]|nr:hypothetical protein [Candidatus Aminicenantes bacterium]
MKRIIGVAAFLVLIAAPRLAPAQPQPDLAIWKEFVQLLKSDTFPLDRIHPDDPRPPESRLARLKDFVKEADWSEWETAPEVVRHGNLVSFITTLGKSRNAPWKYVFCFIVENGRWFYRFTEGIFIRLDQIGDLPADAAGFPDLSEERKQWMRQEIYWSKMVWLYNEMTRLKGTEYALNFIRDGAGYALAATTWIPFYPTPRAFILYLCWEQAKLQGNKVTLEKLDENEAVVRFDDHQFFALYTQTSHLKEQIALGDYIGIFGAMWQDRAWAAGWDLQIDGQGRQIFLRFSRVPKTPGR